MSAILLPGGAVSLGAPPRLPRTATTNRSTGLAVVVLVHVLFFWALTSGLARQAIEIVKKPIEMSIIPEAPPPPPPPKVEKIKEIPKAQTPPPPAYVPPPEVVVAPQPAPVITATRAEPPKEPVVIAPPPPPAPPAPVVEAKPAPVKQEISLACPGYKEVIGQMLEEAVERVGLVGTVRSRISVKGSQVVDVTPLSGPKEYYKYVQAAVKRMKCSAGGADEVLVQLDINFK